MDEQQTETVQVGEKDVAELLEVLEGFKTMLLAHERRLGIIEQVLLDALPKKVPQDHRRKQK